MKISSDSPLPALLEALRPPGTQTALHDNALLRQDNAAETAAPTEVAASSEASDPDPGEALLALDVWSGHGTGKRMLAATDRPPMPSRATDAAQATDRLAAYVLKALG